MTLPQQQQQQPPLPQQSQHFLLKWNNHRSNMVSVFDSLLQSENLVDVTLAVEGQFLKGHKIVLSACSPYFEAMFVNQTPGEKHPILIFHDMKFAHLKTLLDFMYRGEISIDEKDLSDVLKVAEALSIRGLSSFESDDEDSDKSTDNNNTSSGPQDAANPNPPNTSTSATAAAAISGGPNSSHSSLGIAGGSSHLGSPSSMLSSPSGSMGFSQPSSSSQSPMSADKKNNNNLLLNSSQQDNHGIKQNPDSLLNGSGAATNNSNKPQKSARGIKKSRLSSAFPAAPTSSTTRPTTSTLPLPTVPIKRKRGRPMKKDTGAPTTKALKPSRTAADKYQTSRQEVKPSLPSRQKVRRRLPKQFGLGSRLNVEKAETRAKNRPQPADDEDIDTDFAMSDVDGAVGVLPPELCNSEPLSEMSVRGLDLFKYASIEDGIYRCTECEKLCIPKTFKNKYSFQRHAFLYHEGNMRKVFPCPVCSREFSRPDKMKNHLRSVHEGRKNAREDSPAEPQPSNDGSASNEMNSSSNGDSSDYNDKM